MKYCSRSRTERQIFSLYQLQSSNFEMVLNSISLNVVMGCCFALKLHVQCMYCRVGPFRFHNLGSSKVLMHVFQYYWNLGFMRVEQQQKIYQGKSTFDLVKVWNWICVKNTC
jgi:hypothetical protein